MSLLYLVLFTESFSSVGVVSLNIIGDPSPYKRLTDDICQLLHTLSEEIDEIRYPNPPPRFSRYYISEN